MSASKASIHFSMILLCASAGVIFQVWRITNGPHEFHSMAKLVVSGREAVQVNDDVWKALNADYGTFIQTLESAEMRRRALERVRALNPNLKECDIEIRVTQIKGSTIFNIVAAGSDPQYTRIFLDALLDEFIAFRQAIRGQAQSQLFKRLFDEFEKKRSAVTKSIPTSAEPEAKKAAEQAYDQLFEGLGWYQTRVEDTTDAAIYERASPGSLEDQDWLLPLFAGAGLGAIGGFMLFYMASLLSSVRSLLAVT